MLIVSVLSAVAIPTFFGQIGKSREAEVQMKLGSIARSQQAYHYENGEFAATMNIISLSSGFVSSDYYDFPDPIVDAVKVKHQATAKNSGNDQTRDYAIGVYFDNGGYYRATCQGSQIGEAVNVGDLFTDPCTNNGNKVQ